MGKVVAEKRKKKKGRPSLLDLQKRSLRQQQQQQQLQNQNQKQNQNHRNPNPNFNTSRRFSQRYPLADDDEDDDREQKKLKLVLRLPRSFNSNREEVSDSAVAAASGSEDESENGENPPKKRKINGESLRHGGVSNGSEGLGFARDKTETDNPIQRTADPLPGTPSDSASATPLPDKKLLVFVLDMLQKKDTYGVFSEPVDPKELPDYHEVIRHPMDFGTVRKKLGSGAYSNLEQFEEDVFLICTNAMLYNSRDTIYYRQARSIQELATKNFQNLRQDSDDNETELVRPAQRGRPPKKLTKRPMGRPPLEPAGSDFSSDATPATAGDHSGWSNTSYDPIRKLALFDKPSSATGSGDVSTRVSNRLRNSETGPRLAQYGNDEVSGFLIRGSNGKYGRKSFVLDDNRRGTYRPSNQMLSGSDMVFSTFDGPRKQLLSVGLHMDMAYARSLARFARNLGSVAWKVASNKIARALPAGTKFGPGWVGENEAPLPSTLPPPLEPQHSQLQISPSAAMLIPPSGSRDSELSDTRDPSKNPIRGSVLTGTHPSSTQPAASNRHSNPTEAVEPSRVLRNSGSGSGDNRFKPSFQQTVNDFNGVFTFPSLVQGSSPLPVTRLARPAGPFGSEAMPSSRRPAMSSSFMPTSPQAKQSEAEESTVESEQDGKISVTSNSLKSGSGSGTGPWPLQSCQDLSPHQKPVSVPPDLNVGFQSPVSPVNQTSGMLVDSQPPDLALQL